MKYDRRLWLILPIAGLCPVVADPLLVSLLGRNADKTFKQIAPPPAPSVKVEPEPAPEDPQVDDPAKEDESQFNFPKKK